MIHHNYEKGKKYFQLKCLKCEYTHRLHIVHFFRERGDIRIKRFYKNGNISFQDASEKIIDVICGHVTDCQGKRFQLIGGKKTYDRMVSVLV